jgi:hypothetical protein
MVSELYFFIIITGGIQYVLAKHHRKCRLANLFNLSNITFCSCVPGHVKKEQAKQPIICGVSEALNYPQVPQEDNS